MAALAAEMKLAKTEVYEVATFYAHFDVVKEGETPPPPVTVRVCDSLSCAMAGADRLLKDLPQALGPDVRVVRAPCMGACDHAPVCAVGHVQVIQATPEKIDEGCRRAGACACAGTAPISSITWRPAAIACSPRLHRQAHARRTHQDRQRRGLARPRRRGLSHRAQVDAWFAPSQVRA